MIFVSHQWTAFREPDPTNTQFALLKGVLRNALAGTLDTGVKLVDTETGIACDLCVNNELAIFNTALLRTYMTLCPEMRMLTLTVRRWAKARAVADPTNATLTSYAWGLLAINAAQGSEPPCVPNLQEIPAPPRTCRDYRASKDCDVTFCEDLDQAQEWLVERQQGRPPCRASCPLAASPCSTCRPLPSSS